MLKTIKTTQYMRLDELIKHIFDNNITDKSFTSNMISEPYDLYRNKVYVHPDGTLSLGHDKTNDITKYNSFKVEIEEEITEDTILQELYSVYYNGIESFRDVYTNASINDIILEDGKQGIETERIYALYKGKIQLIWEREEQ